MAHYIEEHKIIHYVIFRNIEYSTRESGAYPETGYSDKLFSQHWFVQHGLFNTFETLYCIIIIIYKNS